jgi:site-specific DNA-methyltransferase (adenine-specific)
MAYNVLCGDAFIKLKEFQDNYFDSCILDGPYGLRFMGKTWDTFDIKSKGEQRDSYAVGEKRLAKGRTTTGFGNSIEAGKYDQSREANLNFQRWFEQLAREIIRVLKPGAYFLSFGGTRTYHRMICGIEDAGFEIRDCIMWTFGSGFPKSYNLTDDLGTALKPAWEPICMARKPLDGTIEQNFKKYGTGVLNIGATRIPGEPWTFGTQTDIKGGNYGTNRPSNGNILAKNVTGGEDGRWPANLIHDGSDEVIQEFPDAPGQMADVRGTEPSMANSGTTSMGKMNRVGSRPKRADSNKSGARFFYCAKTSHSDRNEGLESWQKKTLNWSSGTQNPGSFQSPNTDRTHQNNHPTVKPTKLMRYLAVLITPPAGKIIDPCCGSGSTGKGGIIEGFDVTLIDQEQQWVDVAIARCAHATKVRLKLERTGKQLSL